MLSDEHHGVGLRIGMHIGLHLHNRSIRDTLPSSSDNKRLEHACEFIGLLSLAENAAAAAAVTMFPDAATARFRNELTEGISRAAIIPETLQICLTDVLRTETGRAHFTKFYYKESQSELRDLLKSPRELCAAYLLLKEIRALEFSAALARVPAGQMSRPECFQRIGLGLVDCAHIWVLGTTTKSDESLAHVDRVLSALVPEVLRICVVWLQGPEMG